MSAKKIAVIDDDPDIVEVMQISLHEFGFDVAATTEGKGVIPFIRKSKPDLIILDFLLSGVDGREVCKEIKKEDGLKNIPLIMMSAHPQAEKTVYEAGADSYLAKPFDIFEMVNLINKLTK